MGTGVTEEKERQREWQKKREDNGGGGRADLFPTSYLSVLNKNYDSHDILICSCFLL